MSQPAVLEVTAAQLTALETEHPQGLTMFQILECLADAGTHISEATFRKYVQLGLLPQSRRVGRGNGGKYNGSQGLYPTITFRYLLAIRARLAAGETLAELQRDMRVVIAQDELGTRFAQVLRGLQKDVAQRNDLDIKFRHEHLREIAAFEVTIRRIMTDIKQISAMLRRTRRVQSRS